MADRVGQQLGNYRLTHLLGQGGFAEVYLGEHPLLGTKVAIKILHTQVAQEDVVQFQEEARILASLRHPHIVRVLDFGIDGQTPYLIMDYAPNGTLRTRHARGTRLPVYIVVGYVKQIAQALQYAHDRKVVHRDIKPENMLIGENNEILLSDFGIALIAQSSRSQGTKDMAGTIAYMAPEQIEAHPRPASDQYSLGIVAYEWLSGTLPFHGSFTEVAVKHSVTPPPPLRAHLPTLSPDIEQVISMALAKRPEERFASVSAFATALEQASQGMPSAEHGRPVSAPYPFYPATPSSSGANIPPPPPGIMSASQPQRPIEPSITNTTQPDPFRHFSAPMPQTPPVFPGPAQATGKSPVSRRAALIGVAGTIAVVAVGAGVFAILQRPSPGDHAVSPSSQTVTPAKPTITPQETKAATQEPTANAKNPLLTYRGHTDWVRAVAWSPDGQRIASCSDDKTVQVWNAADGSKVFTYRGHTDVVKGVVWSPDGKQIASCSDDKTVQVWNAADGSKVFTSGVTFLGDPFDVYSVGWSPDGKRIATGSADVQVWNASNGTKMVTSPDYPGLALSLAWSPDGQRIVSGSFDKVVEMLNASDGSIIFTYRGHSGEIDSVAWSPDGKQVVSGSYDKTVQVWNAADGSKVFTYTKHTDEVNAVAWSPDGKRIASGSSDKTVQVWNASDGSNISTYRGDSFLYAVAWSPDGKRVASGSIQGTVQIWQAG
jgi:WD40 repeat protein